MATRVRQIENDQKIKNLQKGPFSFILRLAGPAITIVPMKDQLNIMTATIIGRRRGQRRNSTQKVWQAMAWLKSSR